MGQGIIRIRCPNLLCGRILAIPGHARGKRVKCRSCGTVMSVPAKQKEVPAAVEKADEDDRAAA